MDEITLPDGTTRRLGNLMPDPGITRVKFSEFPEQKLISRDAWPGLMKFYDSTPFTVGLPPVHDQNGIGCCNASCTTAMVEFARNRQGLRHVSLSAADLYARINRGVDQGSLLEDALREVVLRGVGTVETCGYLWKSGEYKGAAQPEERRRFRALEVIECPTFDHCLSAVFHGWALNTGIMWHPNYTPGADGWLPRGQGQAGGHSIFGYKPALRGNEWGIWHMNSWGADWPKQGKGGFFVIPESAYSGPVGGWFAMRAVVDEGGVVPAEL